MSKKPLSFFLLFRSQVEAYLENLFVFIIVYFLTDKRNFCVYIGTKL